MKWAERTAIEAIRSTISVLEEGWEDASVLTAPPGGQIVLSSDQINARHAFPGEDLRTLVRRGLVEALSDLAATGADVWGVQVDVRAPDEFTVTDFQAIGTGIDDQLAFTGGQLLQGSNLSRGEFGVSSTVVGLCRRSPPMRRAGARVGDLLLVSGPLGGWNGALALLNSGLANTLPTTDWAALIGEFLGYQAELAFGRVIARTGTVTACIDCNDVLLKTALDLGHASQVRIVLEPDVVPVARSAVVAARLLGTNAATFALRGVSGDNRLLFTCAPQDVPQLLRLTERALGRSPSIIGSVAHGNGVSMAGSDGCEVMPPSTEVVYQESFTAGDRPLLLTGFPPRGRALHKTT